MKAYPECHGFKVWSKGDGSNVELTDLTLSYDEKMKTYYLSACYRYEDDSVIEDVYIPKMLLPIDKHHVVMEQSIHQPFPVCDIGLGPLNLCANSEGLYMWARTVEEKTHEMTLDEIEKVLGYKVKIVNTK